MILLLAALIQAAPSSPAPEPARQVCADGQQVPADQPCPAPRVFRIFFDSGKAELSRDAQSTVKEVAGIWQTVRGVRLVIAGHSDRSGPAVANVRSSRERAMAVQRALQEAGVDRSALVTVARGETEPLLATVDGVREPQNRRVEISFEPR